MVGILAGDDVQHAGGQLLCDALDDAGESPEASKAGA